jgi:hypothetical protein
MDGDYGRGEGRREERKDGGWGFSVRLLAEAEVKGEDSGEEARERGKDRCVCMSF